MNPGGLIFHITLEELRTRLGLPPSVEIAGVRLSDSWRNEPQGILLLLKSLDLPQYSDGCMPLTITDPAERDKVQTALNAEYEKQQAALQAAMSVDVAEIARLKNSA